MVQFPGGHIEEVHGDNTRSGTTAAHLTELVDVDSVDDDNDVLDTTTCRRITVKCTHYLCLHYQNKCYTAT